MTYTYEAPITPQFLSTLFRRVYGYNASRSVFGLLVLGIPSFLIGIKMDSYIFLFIGFLMLIIFVSIIYGLFHIKRQFSKSKDTFIRLTASDDKLQYETDSLMTSVKWEMVKCSVEYNAILVLAIDKRGNRPLVSIPSKDMPIEMKDFIEDRVLEAGGKLIERRTNLLFSGGS